MKCTPGRGGAVEQGGRGGKAKADPTDLPRPCAMVVPDFELICEIMLVAEGFLEARLLARKFITLYTLCKELLSKQVCAAVSWAHGARAHARGWDTQAAQVAFQAGPVKVPRVPAPP